MNITNLLKTGFKFYRKYLFLDAFIFDLLCKVDQGDYYQTENAASPSKVFLTQTNKQTNSVPVYKCSHVLT